MHPTTLRARRLRASMTDAERRLWQHLRRRGLGVRFRRQHPIGPYLADFACVGLRLVIEADGGQHAAGRRRHDEARDRWLRAHGWRVLRFWNHEVLGATDSVLERIRMEVEALAKAGRGASRPADAEPAAERGNRPVCG
ncbi:endonuclease domain-containing protein [Inmirania thermothiophila]|uniref:Very-short-patch-repair endonuclease n=1 Tax=Inmirania thermothiophila TaxID=1750597 RepID=A0A3N1XXF7_9GAMM|nr:DUF559 domain-containing protein [Inmirania thermothiophila]ROR29617.1 very-short-patch-repair endonuclease [Inmirania thermothiophila]